VRTAAGSVIMIGIAGIAALPVLKTVVLALIYKAAAALCEIVSDKKYADVLESASGSLMLMAGISGVISIMFIIIIGIIVGTGNAALAIAS
jgi:stage III sporulation protein AE